jgi:hypothetical protein
VNGSKYSIGAELSLELRNGLSFRPQGGIWGLTGIAHPRSLVAALLGMTIIL